jgi:hypothetical protein
MTDTTNRTLQALRLKMERMLRESARNYADWLAAKESAR